MTETNQFQLPLVQASQAQKHVTVNEALARLDAAAQLRLESIVIAVPPVTATDGEAYAVPAGAVNAWEGHDGEVAVSSNGGWVYLSPRFGWKAWIVDTGQNALFDGTNWRLGAVALSPKGASTGFVTQEFVHTFTPGATNLTTTLIEENLLVHGVTGRVLTNITGLGLTGFRIGSSIHQALYGFNYALTAGQTARNLSSKPNLYTASEPLILAAIGGDFQSGSMRMTIHGMRLEPCLS